MNENILKENFEYEKNRALRNIVRYEKLREDKAEALSIYLLAEITEESLAFYRNLYNADMTKRNLTLKAAVDTVTETSLRQLRNANLMFENYISDIRKKVTKIEKKQVEKPTTKAKVERKHDDEPKLKK